MRTLIIILFTIISLSSWAQIVRVKFTDATFENGMLYPVAQMQGADEIASKINKDLLSKIQDLKEADFCVGQYGFVQKGPHIQIHIFCNCIDFDESQNRYYLYNTESGEHVRYSDILSPKKKKATSKRLEELTNSFIKLNKLDVSKESLEKIDTETLDAYKVRFKRDGIDLWLKDNNWGEKPLFMTWGSMREYMKFSFI